MPDDSDLCFELHVQRDPRMVSIVRRFVEKTFERLVGDPGSVFRVSMAAHELLENACKYGVSKRSGLTVSFEGKDSHARIRLTNQTTPEHVARLRERVRQLQEAKNPFEVYQELMRRSRNNGDESGLGLARIAAEGELELSLEVEGNTVTIMASYHAARTVPRG